MTRIPFWSRTVNDPIFGMKVARNRAATFNYIGKTYYFCTPGCRLSFAGNPKKNRK